jgi:ABC-2 type transport system ATP-binding protein
VIEISNLTRQFGNLTAVDELSLRVNDGEIFGLLGPNGAGKTTTVKMIVGMLEPTGGEIRVNGFSVKSDLDKIKSQLGYVPESSALYENLTGREHLDMVCELHHFPYEKKENRIARLIELLRLKDFADERIAGYSKGMKQKLLLAGALIHNPRLLILDEPFSGLDANTVSVFKEVIREFTREGRIVIFCSHILEVVERICTRLVIIDKGKKRAEGTPQDIVQEHNTDSLSAAFSELTGVTDVDEQAHDILRALEGEL